VGALRLKFLETPGHTPESVSILVTDTRVSDQPQMVLTGDMVSAGEAVAWGLANGVVPAEELMPTVRKVAATILSRGPVALSLALDAVLRGGEAPLPEGLAIEADLFGLVSATEDVREGMQAFLEKREARFRGR